MYGVLLEKVYEAIDNFTEPSVDTEFSEFYQLLFSTHDKEKVLEKRRKREQMRRNLKTGAVMLSVAGELYYIIRKVKS